MKNYLILLAIVCLLCSCDKNQNEDLLAPLFFGSSGTNPEKPIKDDPLSKGLVAFYPFDGNTRDESGNYLNGTLIGDIRSQNGHNSESKCLYFPGIVAGQSERFVYVPFSEKLKMNEWTINLWFYYENTKNKGGALMQMGRDKVPGSFLIQKWRICIVNSAGRGQYGPLYEDEREPSPSEWHMLTSQVKGATITQYLDGKLMWSDVLSAEYKNEVKQDLYFGVSKWNGDDDLYFDGCIDDVRIYNRILSESEIQQLYAK